MTRRFSSISVQTTLASSISNTALTLAVPTGAGSTLLGGVSLAGGDADQFSITVDPDTVNAEIIYITGVSGDTYTIQRGKEGTSAVSHTAGAVIKHVLTSGDMIYLVGAVVAITDLATGMPFPGSTSGTNTLKAPAITGTTVTTLPNMTDTLVGKTTTDTLTNKTIALGSNAVSGTIAQFNSAVTDADLATLDGTETLTGKTLTDAKIHPAINAQSGTTYTLVLADDNKVIPFTNVGAITCTVPPHSSVPFPIGATITIINDGTGLVTFAPGSGVTIRGYGTLKLRSQDAWGTLVQTTIDTWRLTGDII